MAAALEPVVVVTTAVVMAAMAVTGFGPLVDTIMDLIKK